MPKRSKTPPKKQLKMKAKQKVQPKTVSITSRKSYWISLTLAMVVFGLFSGYSTKMAIGAIGLLLVSVLTMIAFAFYINFHPSTMKTTQRALYLFAGASIIGFCIWAAIVLSFNATGINSKIASSIGINFFAITSLIICLTAGAFIGELIGKNKESLQLSLHKIKNKLFRLGNEA